jgi:hypothetical protein
MLSDCRYPVSCYVNKQNVPDSGLVSVLLVKLFNGFEVARGTELYWDFEIACRTNTNKHLKLLGIYMYMIVRGKKMYT